MMAEFDPTKGFDIEPSGTTFNPDESFERTPSGGDSSSGAISEVFGAIKDLPKGAPTARAALRRTGEGIKDTSKTYRETVLGMAPDIDYETGASYLAQKDAQRASNDDELKAALGKYYGEGNFGQDAGGRWWVKEGGKKVALYPFSSVGGGLMTGMAGLQASGPEFAGSMVGAVGGGMLGGPAGAFAGGVGGALVGKGIDETVKWAEGLYRKTPEQLAELANSVGAWNSVFSGAGPVAKQAFGAVGSKLRSILGVTPETRAMTQRALERGVTPPIESIAPEFKSLARKQQLRDLVMGDPQHAAKVSAVQGQVRDALAAEGYPTGQIERAMTEVFDPSTALSEAEVGRLLVPRVRGHVQAMETVADQALEQARNSAAAARRMFEVAASRHGPELGADVAGQLRDSRRALGTAFEPAYAHVDEMVDGRAIVPTAGLQLEAQRLSRHIPPDRVPAIIREIAAMEENILPSQAHRLRSRLREMADSGDLTPDIGNHEFSQMARAVDEAFHQAARGEGPWGVHAAENRGAIDFMRRLDRDYARQIAFYNDQRVNQIARLADAGMPPDPQEVARLIAQNGYTERTRQILGHLTPEGRREVASAHMRMMFDDTERQTAALGFESSGRAFYNVVNEARPALEEIYGPVYGRAFVDRLEQTARDLAALDGRLDVRALEEKVRGLGPGAMLDALSQRLQMLRQVEAFAKESPLAALNSGHPDAVDQAFRVVVQPKADTRLREVYAFFGEGAEMDAIRDYARRDIVKRAVYEDESRVQMIDGPAISKAFADYTQYQKDILFPNGAAQDLRDIANMSRFLFPKAKGDQAGPSFAASNITLHVGPNILNPRTLYADMRWGYVWWMGWLADRPAVARMIAGLERKEPGAGSRMAKAMMRWALTQQTHGGPRDANTGLAPVQQ